MKTPCQEALEYVRAHPRAPGAAALAAIFLGACDDLPFSFQACRTAIDAERPGLAMRVMSQLAGERDRAPLNAIAAEMRGRFPHLWACGTQLTCTPRHGVAHLAAAPAMATAADLLVDRASPRRSEFH
ncbi:hypothetical protein [Variovorax saccharolyticus]|uniref:hypothetical protein n=1 Tax=Variovorax saccharolyticus TaxID=3053516 RepID=UPI002575283A|nr:hypothetical protein [Variovorax sp. J22R187]MDM0022331.1 hypothetical protein [Variovorax sp. J22R187]